MQEIYIVEDVETIVRYSYIEQVERQLGKQTIIVLVGQRRVGKSCILKTLRDMKSKEANANVIYIDKEKREFDDIKTYAELNAYIESRFKAGRHNYVMIDEVQDIAEFERTVRSYRTEPDTDIIITGSNAHMLSTDLTTLIGGRYKEIRVLPLSYTEFLTFHNLTNCDNALTAYIEYGGMPGLTLMGLDDNGREYQADIYHTVLLKDVVMRNSIRNVVFLENLVRFLADNTGKLISANNVSKYMRSQGKKITPTVIINYINYLAEAFIVNKVCRYDIHGKRIFESNDKLYFEDFGMRNAIVGGSRNSDIEKVLENVVYLHLVRLGYKVFVGQLQAGEVDFVCVNTSGERKYVQVAYIIADDTTRQREFGNLRNIADNYPKYVISMSPLLTKSDENGIVHLHLRQFLTEGL